MSSEGLNLEVPGFTVSQKDDQKPFVKSAWYLMFIVCSFIALRQMSERISYYFSYPTMLTFTLGEMEPFPIITFCPSSESEHWCIYMGEEDWCYPMPVRDPFNDLISKCELLPMGMAIENCKLPELWTQHKSVYGFAYTLSLEKAYNSSPSSVWFVADNLTNFETFRYYLFKSEFTWKVLLHDHEDDIAYGCATSAIDIDLQTEFHITYVKKKTMYENVPTRPCQSQSDYRKCVNECLDEAFAHSGRNCRLPFMSADSVEHLPDCDPDDIYEKTRSIGAQFESKNMVAGCACARSCENSRFEFDIDTDNLEGKTVIWVNKGRLTAENLQESISYTGYSLLCELGGIIGFYLGACLITFIELIQHLSKRLYAHITGSKGRPYVRKHLTPDCKQCPNCDKPLTSSKLRVILTNKTRGDSDFIL